MRMGPLATMVSSRARPASVSDGEPVQVSAARRAGNIGATMPAIRTAANRAPTAWTQPDPLEWATPAHANMATALPTTGANHVRGCTRLRRRRPPGRPVWDRLRRAGDESPHDAHPPATRATVPMTTPATAASRPKAARASTTPHTPATIPPKVALTVRHPGGRRPDPAGLTLPGQASR